MHRLLSSLDIRFYDTYKIIHSEWLRKYWSICLDKSPKIINQSFEQDSNDKQKRYWYKYDENENNSNKHPVRVLIRKEPKNFTYSVDVNLQVESGVRIRALRHVHVYLGFYIQLLLQAMSPPVKKSVCKSLSVKNINCSGSPFQTKSSLCRVPSPLWKLYSITCWRSLERMVIDE